jgi:hypothetical protein
VILSKLQEAITFFLMAGSLGAILEIFSDLEMMRCWHDGLHAIDPDTSCLAPARAPGNTGTLDAAKAAFKGEYEKWKGTEGSLSN